MTDVSNFASWEINYAAEFPKLFNWYEYELAQTFVADKDVNSIIFYTSGITDTVGVLAHETKRIDIARLTKEEFANVTRVWIDDQMKPYVDN